MDGQARLDDNIDGIDYIWYTTRRYRGNSGRGAQHDGLGDGLIPQRLHSCA
jgi:hypothetical protein